MNKKLLILPLFAFLVFACGPRPGTATPIPVPPPTATLPPKPPSTPTDSPVFATVTAVCISSVPVQKDIDRALSYTEGVFDELEWEQSYAIAENRVSVTWLNNPEGAIVYLEALIFPCGYEEPDLNRYYSDENWKAIFQNYESYNLIDECKTDDGLRLYEFEAQNFGFEYGIKYWVESDTDTRVISTMVVFPLDSESLMDEYSSMLFPDYRVCP